MCRVTNDCVEVKVRDYDREGMEILFSHAFGQEGPMFLSKDIRSPGNHYFWLTRDELKTLILGLQIIQDRIEADDVLEDGG